VDALEAFSPLTGDPMLVVDLRSGAGMAAPDTLATACARLTQLACPSVAIRAASPTPEAATLVDRFDVVVDSETEAAPILETVARTPLAAMALVQLLRQGAGLGQHDSLIAESFVYATLQGGREFASWLAARPPALRPEPSLEPAVLVRRTDGRLDVTLNRPTRRNAFSAEMRDALVDALAIALGDPSITEIVLQGAGPAFCSGGDLDEFGTLPDPTVGHAVRSTRNAARCLAACAERLRAEVHGACVGAGVELPAFARRVVATKDAFFQLPEVAMGLVPGAGGTVSIARRIGRQRTAYLALAGVRLDAPTALRWGLVDEIAG